MVLFPKINYPKFNLGIIVPSQSPHDILSFLCWFSFCKNMPKVNPIIFVSGNPQIDTVTWARKLGFPIIHVHQNFEPNKLVHLQIWDSSYIVVLSNVFCMRKFEFRHNIREKEFLVYSHQPKMPLIQYGQIEENKILELAILNIKNNSSELRARLLNSNGIFPSDKSLNQIKLESFWNDTRNIRTLFDKEATP